MRPRARSTRAGSAGLSMRTGVSSSWKIRSADDMAEKGLIARNEADARKDALHENKVRLEVEQKRLAAFG